MFYNDRKTIAVLICDSVSYYQETLCHTLTKQAQKLGYNLAFFTFFSSYGTSSKNAYGENNIVNLPPYEQFDAIIICPDTFLVEQAAMNRIRESLNTRARGPVVCIRRQIDEHYSVLVNNHDSIGKMVRHFVYEHNLTRIAMMTGPSIHPDSISRFANYRRALTECGLPFDETLVFEGDFWRSKAIEAAHYFTEELDVPPQAVICANDYMAISLCNALVMNGYLVPDDIAISGFDNIKESTNQMPPLTTISVPVEEMAVKALEIVDNLLKDIPVEPIQYVNTKEYIRNSCGCNTYDMRSMITTRVAQSSDYDRILNQTLNNTFVSIALENLQNVPDIGSYLHLLDDPDNDIRDLHLCLGEGRSDTYPKYRSNHQVYPKRSTSMYSLMDRTEIRTSTFDTCNLLPPETFREEPVSYFFSPIHYLDYTFGYIAISYYNHVPREKTFQSWLAILGNAIENVRVTNESNHLLDELNNLYVHDSLTGLYNRRGFEQISSQQYKAAMKGNLPVMLLGIDMDNLKTVNDKYGHLQGDLAIKTLAAALKHAATSNEVCARVGGDEFNVIGVNFTKIEAELFIERFNDYLAHYNSDSCLAYTVEASYGYVIATASDNYSLEECINFSDSNLYQQKRRRKKARRKK